jgi:transposase InsO family protein
VKDETWFWHVRLGHVNFDSLKMMAQNEMLKGLPSIIHSNQLCEGCLVGKQFHKNFPKKSTLRANQPLQEIHVDVCETIKPCLFGKKLYFLFSINDYNRKTWVYFLKEKSNVFSCFKKFKALVQKESDYSIKSLRMDMDNEFCSNDFNEFYEDHGIKRLLMVPRSPQQNEVVERKNRSILNMARRCLKTFWLKL